MRSETTWYAFDETEFDNKEECEEYEKKTLDMINSVMFFDYDMNHIKNPTIGDIESLAFYMVIKDAKKAKELFDYLPQYVSFETPRFGYENGDKFEFNEAAEEWINIDEEHRRILDKVNRFNEALEKILNKTLHNVTN